MVQRMYPHELDRRYWAHIHLPVLRDSTVNGIYRGRVFHLPVTAAVGAVGDFGEDLAVDVCADSDGMDLDAGLVTLRWPEHLFQHG